MALLVTLGEEYRDRITGFVGTATSRTQFLNGCIQVGLEPKMKRGSAKVEEVMYFDEDRLVHIGTKQRVESSAPRGGPTRRGVSRVRR